MDGDTSAKSMDQGANAANKGGADFTEGIHEAAHQAVCFSTAFFDGVHGALADWIIVQTAAGEKTAGTGGQSMFDKGGAIGKQFTCTRPFPHLSCPVADSTSLLAQGTLGGTAQAVGGPFHEQGMIGKQFASGGTLGGAAQMVADNNQKKT